MLVYLYISWSFVFYQSVQHSLQRHFKMIWNQFNINSFFQNQNITFILKAIFRQWPQLYFPEIEHILQTAVFQHLPFSLKWSNSHYCSKNQSKPMHIKPFGNIYRMYSSFHDPCETCWSLKVYCKSSIFTMILYC